MNTKRKSCFYSIDFEDFSYDFKRNYLSDSNAVIREEELWKSYEIIKNFCLKSLNDSKITFFVTGIIAEKCPQLVAEISNDGHEVACHYYQHDYVINDDLKIFEKNLRKAIEKIEEATNEYVNGFRAPYFSIPSDQYSYFKIIEKYLKYDSSLCFSKKSELDDFYKKSGIKSLKLFPLSKYGFGILYPKLKTGGTYLKMYPISILLTVLNKNFDSEFLPSIYVHPYEIVTDESFTVKMEEMHGISAIKKIILSIRQMQWNRFGNKSVMRKLNQISSTFKSAGSYQDFLDM